MTAPSAATRASDVEATLAQVHRDVETAMGKLCLVLSRRDRRFRPADATGWAQDLRDAARKLDELVGEMRRG